MLVFSDASDANRTPRPVASARMVPVETSRFDDALAERADRESAGHAEEGEPGVTGMPTSTANVAPGKPMWARAWAAKASRRITTK